MSEYSDLLFAWHGYVTGPSDTTNIGQGLEAVKHNPWPNGPPLAARREPFREVSPTLYAGAVPPPTTGGCVLHGKSIQRSVRRQT
jgi:hypothetical protein